MKKGVLCFLLFTNFIYSMGNYFIDDFNDNKNKWYTSKTSTEDIGVRDGNYVIRNLDQSSDLSLAMSKLNSDFYALEYNLKMKGHNESLYGVFIELESLDKFYLILNKNTLAYFYEHEDKFGILEEFEKFPYLNSDDYNSIVFLKDGEAFTFLINQIPTEKSWALKGSKIKRVGLYLNNSTDIYVDSYTEFTL